MQWQKYKLLVTNNYFCDKQNHIQALLPGEYTKNASCYFLYFIKLYKTDTVQYA